MNMTVFLVKWFNQTRESIEVEGLFTTREKAVAFHKKAGEKKYQITPTSLPFDVKSGDTVFIAQNLDRGSDLFTFVALCETLDEAKNRGNGLPSSVIVDQS